MAEETLSTIRNIAYLSLLIFGMGTAWAMINDSVKANAEDITEIRACITKQREVNEKILEIGVDVRWMKQRLEKMEDQK